MDNIQFLTLCDSIQPPKLAQRPSNPSADRVAIQDALLANEQTMMPYSNVINMRTGFIMLSIIDEVNANRYEECFYILEKVTQYFTTSGTKEVADWNEPVWTNVITFIKQQPDYPRTNAFTLEEFHKQERERAFAAKRLMQYGANVSVVDCNLIVENLEGAINLVNSLAQSIGGQEGINKLLSTLEYKREIGRYLVPHQGNTPVLSAVDPEVPYGYLTNLFIKYIGTESTSSNVNRDYKQLKALTTDICTAVYDVQKYDIWQDIFRPQSDIIGFMRDMIVRFDIYTLPQTSSSFTMAWCTYLCKTILRDTRCSSELAQYIKQYQRLLHPVSSMSQIDCCVRIPRSSSVGRFIDRLSPTLAAFLVKDATSVNQAFNLPVDYKSVDYMLTPIYSTDEYFILLPKTIGVWSWYEALQCLLRKYSPNALFSEIGTFIEDFLRQKMLSHGIISHTGKYTYNTTVIGDADIVVEAQQGDALIECKKKSLSRNAQTGDNLFIWDDLTEFLKSQMQCSKTENGIRNFSPLELVDKAGKSYLYSWRPDYEPYEQLPDGQPEKRERYVAKVSLMLKDYGPMQDKVLVSNVISNLLGKVLPLTVPPTGLDPRDATNFQKSINKCNALIAEMTTYYQSIGGDNATFHCRFYSMEQLYHLIRVATSQDHFVKLLAQDNISTGTFNFWNELLIIEQLKSSWDQ